MKKPKMTKGGLILFLILAIILIFDLFFLMSQLSNSHPSQNLESSQSEFPENSFVAAVSIVNPDGDSANLTYSGVFAENAFFFQIDGLLDMSELFYLDEEALSDSENLATFDEMFEVFEQVDGEWFETEKSADKSELLKQFSERDFSQNDYEISIELSEYYSTFIPDSYLPLSDLSDEYDLDKNFDFFKKQIEKVLQ